ncbi:hypothetical protein BDR03DRAFT_589699 [Suillus americanus]|nr:hypothetical protein BDR03DRAFT_589699 [Suillus americanus]
MSKLQSLETAIVLLQDLKSESFLSPVWIFDVFNVRMSPQLAALCSKRMAGLLFRASPSRFVP